MEDEIQNPLNEDDLPVAKKFDKNVIAVISKIEALEKKKIPVMQSILLLVFTLLLGLSYTRYNSPVQIIVLLLIVIIYHEAGHFIAMRILGYKDAQMFFIPLVSALVPDNNRDVSSSKKAVVALAGPV